MSSIKNSNNLIWLDLEMTGLDPETQVILEIGTVVTDGELNTLAEGPQFALYQPPEILEKMEPWSKEHHGASGLTQRCQESKVTLREAEEKTTEFLAQWCFEKKSPLCGNSIGQDRRFLVKYMPKLHDFFHYRNLDVSSIKELVIRWYPEQAYKDKKENRHQVMADIYESLAEIKHYRKTVFK